MLITRITAGDLHVPLKVPFKTALRSVTEVHTLVLTIETDTGLTGYGEASPMALITGDLIDAMRAALDFLVPRLLGRSLLDFNAILRTLHQSLMHHSGLKAGIEMALYDLRAQALGLPLYQLLGGGDPQLKTDITISVNPIDTMIMDARRAVADGFDCLKIKLGGHTWRDDVQTVLTIERALGPHIALRLDANQGWSPKHAVQVIAALEQAGVALECVEQPVKADDLAGLKFVTDHVLTPVVADEAVFTLPDAMNIFCTQSADVLNLKLMKTAGLSQAIEIANLARHQHRSCMMGCMIESAISTTAAVHFAVAFDDVVAYIDLDGPQLCAANPVDGGVASTGPWLDLPDTPGLGITAVHGLQQLKVYAL